MLYCIVSLSCLFLRLSSAILLITLHSDQKQSHSFREGSFGWSVERACNFFENGDLGVLASEI